MAELRVLVVEDEPLVRRDLIRQLGSQPEVSVVGEARNGLEALERIEALTPDVVFLDVQMPELDGLGVVSSLEPGRPPLPIFVTAFDQYALAAFDAEAVDYVLKPFDRERLARALARARKRLAEGAAVTIRDAARALAPPGAAPQYLHRIAVRAARRIVVVDITDVRWIEASDNYARLHLATGSYLLRRTMRDLEAGLDPARFARIHRSAIVNLREVRELRSLGDGDYEIGLADGRTRLTLTRSYRTSFLERYGGVA